MSGLFATELYTCSAVSCSVAKSTGLDVALAQVLCDLPLDAYISVMPWTNATIPTFG
jgi:hypothetical protein